MRTQLCLWAWAALLLGLPACVRDGKGGGPISDDSTWPWSPRSAHYKADFQKGAKSAQADIEDGKLGWDGMDGGEDEAMRKLWCFRKVLREKHGVLYRLRAHRPTERFIGRVEGYQSVMEPHLSAVLGKDWSKQAWEEAEALSRDHWPELERQYLIDEGTSLDREDYFVKQPITDAERLAADPFRKYYAYEDENERKR